MTQMTSTIHSISKKLTDFRNACPLKTIPIQDKQWTFYDTEGELEPLLMLSGGGGLAESFFPQILALSSGFRVIAPNIPTKLKSMEQVIDGLSTLLNALEIPKIHVYGASLGGHIAQIFIRKHYARVGDVILSHTAIPTEKLATKTQMQYRLLQMYPSMIIKRMFKQSIQTAIANSPIKIRDEERDFWMNYFAEQYQNSIMKSHIVSRAGIARDYFQNFTFHSSDLNYWDGRMLIVESAQDELYDEGERGALISMYPRAWIHTFDASTHLATILAHQQSNELVAGFLKGDAYETI